MIKGLINLPFKVLARAARAVQDRQDAAMKATHGDGEAGDDFATYKNVPSLDVPDDFDPGQMGVTVAEVKALLASGADLALLDVRSKALPDGLPGAEHIPNQELTIRLAELPPEGRRIIVFCEDGDQSEQATRFLRHRGREDAWVLAGGLKAWRKG